MFFVDFMSSQVVLLGMDILSALVSRLQEKFRTQVGTGEAMILRQKLQKTGYLEKKYLLMSHMNNSF